MGSWKGLWMNRVTCGSGYAWLLNDGNCELHTCDTSIVSNIFDE